MSRVGDTGCYFVSVTTKEGWLVDFGTAFDLAAAFQAALATRDAGGRIVKLTLIPPSDVPATMIGVDILRNSKAQD